MSRIYLTNLLSDVAGYKLALIDQRSPESTALATSITGTTASGTDIQCTDTSGGTALKWITKPMLEAVSVSATAMFINFWAKESNALANTGMGCKMLLYTAGAESTVFGGFAASAAELTTTSARTFDGCVYGTSNLTAQTVAAADRIVLKPYVNNVGTMAPGYAVTLAYDGPTEGADGDSFVEVNEVLRVNERQLKSGTMATATGVSQAKCQEFLDAVDWLDGNKIVDKTALQIAYDDVAFERDNQ